MLKITLDDKSDIPLLFKETTKVPTSAVNPMGSGWDEEKSSPYKFFPCYFYKRRN